MNKVFDIKKYKHVWRPHIEYAISVSHEKTVWYYY